MSDLRGRAGLVTGAGSGIGRATAMALAAAGAAVVVSDVSADTAHETTDLITASGGQALAVACDVTVDAQVAALVETTVRHFGSLDFAHNNAGVLGMQVSLVRYSEEDYDRILNVNLKSVFLCLRHELPKMLAAAKGAIVNTASAASIKGGAADAVYTASKHGVAGITKTAALEVARKGVRINAVCPGVIETGMTQITARDNPEQYAKAASLMPVGRLGQPEEIADAVVWLCSDESRLVTGHLLVVDGGWTVG